jgi:hypothetical protein
MKRNPPCSCTLIACASVALAVPALGGTVDYLLIPGSNGGGIDVSDDGMSVLIGNSAGIASLWREG